MTESEWMMSGDPQVMLIFIVGHNANVAEGIGGGILVPDRKFRLFACACCRLAGRKSEEVDEMEAEGCIIEPDLGGHRKSIFDDVDWAFQWVRKDGSGAVSEGKCADILRDIIGNPFQPLPIFKRCVKIKGKFANKTVDGHPDHTVYRIAEAIYNKRKFDVMPILADALEDAGCTDEKILMHCRNDMIHNRGCWVLDSILGLK